MLSKSPLFAWMRPPHLTTLLCALAATLTLYTNAFAQNDDDNEATSDAETAAEMHEIDLPAADADKDNTRAALYYALQPRQQQSEALSLLFPDDPTWSRQAAWLDAVADQATIGSATWTERRCENTLEGAQQAFAQDADRRTENRRTQLQAAILLDAAAHCSQEPYVELALRAVSFSIPQMRESRTLPKLRDAIVFLASAGTVDRLQKTDARLLIPFLDALIHLQDYAALERVTTLALAAKPTVGKDRLESAANQAANAPRYTLPIEAPEGCRPTLNGERIRTKTVEVPQGTHLVGCQGQNARLRYYDRQNTALFD